jgi:oligo-alginate lyase
MISIREKSQRFAWCAESLKKMADELNELLAVGVAIPEEPGGWWHQYVCPEHHTELLFDPLEDNQNTFQCPYGCALEGEPYRGAWLVFKHQSLARFTLQAAAVYAGTKEERYAELGRRLIVQYARQYPLYPVHPDAQPWMLKGRAFHQALTEAIWATTLIRAYLLLVDEGVVFSSEEKESLETFLAMMESSMTQYRSILIHDRKNPENNYTAWLNAALACVYAARLNDSKMNDLKQLIHDEGGLIHHLTIGVKPDGFEFEGSTYYHLFVLRAYFIAVEMAARFGLELYEIQGEQGQSFEGMLDVMTELADSQGMLPALHDGPYQRIPYAREIIEVFEIGIARYGKPRYAAPLFSAYRQLGEMDPKRESPIRGGLEAVVFGVGELPVDTDRTKSHGSLLLADSGFAVLRQGGQPLSVLADFGPHGGSHGHFDKLHISLDHQLGPIAPEWGMVPYGSSLRKGWYAETASHNTVSLDGQSQAPHTGECVRFEAGNHSTYLWMRSKDSYPGCIMNRHLLLTKDLLLDWFDVECEDKHEIDWRFQHLGKTKASDLEWESTDHEDRELQTLTHRRVQGEGGGRFGLSFQDGVYRVSMTLSADLDCDVYRTRSPGPSYDPTATCEGLLIRKRGNRATFVAAYRDGDEPIQLFWRSGKQGERELIVSDGSQSWSCIRSDELGLIVTAKEGEESPI